jgi:hypothetical protein
MDNLRERIQERAYAMFMEREGQPGDPLEDWLKAEQEVLSGMAAKSQDKKKQKQFSMK